ncbi:MAG: acyl-CoA/acyl-ACP dehydrogenase [Deltaproteobacteria bacterium]|nr:acyl-CoA/acyl-ACP dehydrogenase [Deltaproteobacteria bacterium]
MTAQPDNFGFGTEEQMLKTEARKFFKNNCDDLKLMDLVAQDPDPHRQPACHWDRKAWKQMGELGWTSLAVPERAGGIGMQAVGVAGLVEEAGRAAFPSPLLTSVNAIYVLSCCRSPEADDILRSIAGGKSASLGIMDPNGSWKGTTAGFKASVSGTTLLDGTSWFVQDAQKVDFFVVKAAFEEGAGLIAVPREAQGLEVVADSIVDLTRDQAHIVFRGVEIEPEWIVAMPGKADAVIEMAEPFIFTMIAADMCGAGEWQLKTCAEYAKSRVQFGRPIGFFQAVKHPIVNMMIMIDEARSLMYNAACGADHEPEQFAGYAHMAKSSAGDMAQYCSDRCIQLHGGMGFTWEATAHLYFKRQLHNKALFGDGRYHRAQLADMMMGRM